MLHISYVFAIMQKLNKPALKLNFGIEYVE